MNLFKITNQVNKNKQLTFAQKAILNQIISYQLNKMPFTGTNGWLSNHWGCDKATIKRIISFLNKNGYVTVKNKRKKHTEGNQTWYNKRYITPIFDNFIAEEIVDKPEVSLEAPIEELQSIPVKESEPKTLEIVESPEEVTDEETQHEEKQHEEIDSYLSNIIHVEEDSNDTTTLAATPVKEKTKLKKMTVEEHIAKLEYKWGSWVTSDKFQPILHLLKNLGITHTDSELLKDEKLVNQLNNQLEYVCETTGKYMKIKIF